MLASSKSAPVRVLGGLAAVVRNAHTTNEGQSSIASSPRDMTGDSTSPSVATAADDSARVFALAIETRPKHQISIWDIGRENTKQTDCESGDAARRGHWAHAAIADFDAHQAVIATLDRTLQLWDLRHLGKPLAVSEQGVCGNRGMFLHASGLGGQHARVACGERGGNIYVFDDGKTGQHLRPLHVLCGHIDDVCWAGFDWGTTTSESDEDQSEAIVHGASLAADGQALFWDFRARGEPARVFPADVPASKVRSADHDEQEEKEQKDLPQQPQKMIVPKVLPNVNEHKIRSMAYKYQGTSSLASALTGGKEGSFRAWYVTDDRQERLEEAGNSPIIEHTDEISAIAADFDVQRAVTASLDRTLRVWDLNLDFLGCDTVLKGHRGGVRTVTADFHVGRALSSAIDHELLMWDLGGDGVNGSREGGCLGSLPMPSLSASVQELLANFRIGRAAAVTRDGGLRVWDLESSSCIASVEGHPGAVFAVQLGGGPKAATSTKARRRGLLMTKSLTALVAGKSSRLSPNTIFMEKPLIVRTGAEGWCRSAY